METLDPGDCTRGQEVFLTHEGVARHGGNEAESRKVVSSSKSTSVTSAAGRHGSTGGFSSEGGVDGVAL